MTFFERFEKLCADNGFDRPISDSCAKFVGVSKQSIGHWKKSGKAPTGASLALVADAFHVSTDYLLGRTDDQTDYTNPDLVAALAGPQLDEFGGDVKKAVALQRAIAEDVRREREPATQTGKGFILYDRLDDVDKGKAEGFIQGLLAQDKYFTQSEPGKEKARA